MIKVDKDKCLGCGACVGNCGEVFDFDENGYAFVKEQPNENNMAKAIESLENCPTGAITKE